MWSTKYLSSLGLFIFGQWITFSLTDKKCQQHLFENKILTGSLSLSGHRWYPYA